ncbi:MAG: ABC transporter permease, partial [Planctomycetota bacterium]|nr:ABC transporter permease [Planctomycetota bacterium]
MRRWKRYAAIAETSARQTLIARGEVVARAIFFGLLLLVFSRLWAVMEAEGQLEGVRAANFIWYLALTEWVVLATPLLYLTIEEDIRRGDLAYRLTRPLSYLGAKLAEGVGELCVRFVTLGALGFFITWWFVGALPPQPSALIAAIPVAFLSMLLLLLFQLAIGLSAFWLHEAAPVYWILQKLLFVFGGLLFPLDIYPDWLAAISSWTPFAAAIYGCGRFAFGIDAVGVLQQLWLLVVWMALTFLALAWLFRRAT